MPTKTKIVSQFVFTKPLPFIGRQKMYISCVEQTRPMSTRTQNAYQLMLTTTIPCQRGHKMFLNLCWPNVSLACFDRKCILTCVDQITQKKRAHIKYILTCVNQTHIMPAKTQNLSQFVLTKPLPFQHGNNMYLNFSCPNASLASDATKFKSTWFEKTHAMSVRTQYVS